MNAITLKRIVVLGTLTGMRSMAGLAVLALPHPGVTRPVMALAAAGEMIADKTPVIGNRIDALPLAGRAIIGALVGALIAREGNQNALLGGMTGSATALIAAHLAYHGRKRLPASSSARSKPDAIPVVRGHNERRVTWFRRRSPTFSTPTWTDASGLPGFGASNRSRVVSLR